ncbi:Aminoglycoside 6-adenylyltransferase [Candidatus Filomicrobium marinum]|uniref:Aminoglycoside 6-adenylyltransferase n=2 Tax=Filomicrobium TaxID=119044 RepID=A0A0D6JCZ0_9HYPH|nr:MULTISPECIES: GNAT family N-acetyltransferase [Filomicrobium]MCV0368374.1 acetyltransferase [Filomicrobium sp.]CFX11579.1 Aminoglycoside 6-adenylyltransferase [Candidatus Filomicrobium marinum]CPR17301.1 Aminoglycoside 6-adenylyltransferase [Candidatus Filomicrobium marinum]SDO36365.1 aminoglycoside 6'-N-acetyltransferase [Filomicrobium insigne]
MSRREQEGPTVRLRPATQADWPLIQSWLKMPQVAEWWGSQSAAQAEIRLVFETPSALARIIEIDGQPIGYTHAIDATFWGETLPDGLPPGAWDVEVFVAAPEHRGRGIGGTALDLLADEVFSTTLSVALCVFVSVRNEHAVRAYESAGFAWVQVWNDPIFGASWLMVRHRPQRTSAH